MQRYKSNRTIPIQWAAPANRIQDKWKNMVLYAPKVRQTLTRQTDELAVVLGHISKVEADIHAAQRKGRDTKVAVLADLLSRLVSRAQELSSIIASKY